MGLVLVWSPYFYDFPDMPQLVEQLRRKEPATCAYPLKTGVGISEGQTVWLYRVRQDPRGIIATGRIISLPYSAPHYDPAKNRNTIYVDIRFESFLDLSIDPPLPPDILIDEVGPEWDDPSHSWHCSERDDATLFELWSRHLEDSEQPTWDEDSFSDLT